MGFNSAFKGLKNAEIHNSYFSVNIIMMVKFKEDEMQHESGNKRTKFSSQNLKEADLGVDSRKIIHFI